MKDLPLGIVMNVAVAAAENFSVKHSVHIVIVQILMHSTAEGISINNG